MPTGGDEAPPAVSGSIFRVTDLPVETQRNILSHCTQDDLICVALVSKHFHNLASAILYREFHIIFPDDDDLSFDSPVDGLAGGLDTFATSEYDYARHLRDLSMDTLSSGLKGERSYQPYLYSSSCGKFFNSLLHLTLKKAPSLEIFRWNVRIELSRPVYRQLRKLPSLRSLHIRMQAGHSYYSRPPPLPIGFHQHHSPPSPVYGHSHWSTAVFQPVQSSMASPHPISHHATHEQPRTRSRSVSKSRVPKPPQEEARLSGFKNLRSLRILDIDDKGLVSEIADSVKNSYSTLTELQLSLSRTLAAPARRISHESDAEESTDEDYQGPPEPQNPNFEPVEPVRAFRAQEEWKTQETLLGKILSVEPSLHKKPQMKADATGIKSGGPKDAISAPVDPGQEFVNSLRGLSSKLLNLLNGHREVSLSQQEVLDTIEKAARKYVESGEPIQVALSHDTEKKVNDTERNDNQSGACHTTPSTTAAVSESNSKDVTGVETAPSARPKTGGILSADVNIEHVEMGDESSRDAGELRTSATFNNRSSSPGASSSRTNHYLSVKDAVRCRPEDTASSQDDSSKEFCTSNETTMDDYIRNTRGLSLEILKIELLPVKASVLCRALNLSTLKELTLLNVGNQTPIWTALAKENLAQPLALRSIYTDNVSSAFLKFASHLEELHELFMLERSVDHLPASFAPRAAVTIDQIRRVVLKKHIHCLKRLMIKDESKEANWDANEKTMIMICSQGVQLEELAVSMNIHAVHAFMQYFSDLASLRAINILHFKSNDTCLWVVRETLRFMVDNLSHHPNMKLEWIAMEDDRVDRVVRPGDCEYEEPCRQRESRTEQQHGITTPFALPAAQQSAQSGHSSDSSSGLPATDATKDDSDSDDEIYDSGSRLRYTTIGPMHFYDVWGIKIFEKEIRSGRL